MGMARQNSMSQRTGRPASAKAIRSSRWVSRPLIRTTSLLRNSRWSAAVTVQHAAGHRPDVRAQHPRFSGAAGVRLIPAGDEARQGCHLHRSRADCLLNGTLASERFTNVTNYDDFSLAR